MCGSGGARLGDTLEDRDEDVGEWADPDCVDHGADPDGATDEDPGGEYADFEGGADPADREATASDGCHQAIAWPGAKAGADVHAATNAIDEESGSEESEAGRPTVDRVGDHIEGQIHPDPDETAVGEGADARPFPQRNPSQQHYCAGADDDSADRNADLCGEALMEHIPWGEAEAGTDHETETDAKESDANHEQCEASWSHFPQCVRSKQNFLEIFPL
jgi:hypothetical protein